MQVEHAQRERAAVSVSRGRSLFLWGVCCALACIVFVSYLLVGVTAGGGQLIMPLDDVYIHFQYARQLANGQPYVYNPGFAPTSGATSFLYPYVLALGYLVGFRDLALGVWALVAGALALALSAYLLGRIALTLGAPFWLAFALVLAFLASGGLTWHFMSGMETGLAALFTLAALYGVLARRRALASLAAALLALTRPEGAIGAGLVSLALLLAETHDLPALLRSRRTLRFDVWVLLPILAVGVQPLVNLLVTGSAIASGNSAKSLFGLIPPDRGVIIGRVVENFTRIWREFFDFGSFGSVPVYLGSIVAVLALVGVALLLAQRKRRALALMIVLWLVGGTALVATLDTAFWHFKRYQIPFMILGFPLASVALISLARYSRRLTAALLGLVFVFGLVNSAAFVQAHLRNAGYVAAQPLRMARWLAANAPTHARVAVHDVGMMRYQGGRTTLDIVGLTTPGAADYWRNGPGSVGELLDRERPDLIASYGIGHGLGLGYLEATDLYAEPLARFTVALDPNWNVALAADTQGIYRPNWTTADNSTALHALQLITSYLDGFELVDSLDVADIVSEREHGYQWTSDGALGGFPTELYQFGTLGCASACDVLDGGRRINGEERFTLNTRPGEAVMVVTRLHPAAPGEYTVYANERQVATRIVPMLPGAWLEVPVLIPAELVTEALTIRIVPQTDGTFYMPYYHWAYQGNYPPLPELSAPLTTLQDGAIGLHDAEYRADNGQLRLSLTWATDGSARGDYKVFVHLLDEAGQIAAQADVRPGNGALPPGNWLPGAFRDTIIIDNVMPGRYRVAIGLYDPLTNARLQPVGGDAFGRFFLDDVEIGSDG